MEKQPVSPVNKVELPKPEQPLEHFSFTEQEKNIQEVFKLSPEIKNIALDSVGLDSKLDNYALELRGQIRKRLRQSSITEKEIDKLTGDDRFAKEHPEIILNLVIDEDVKNLKETYEDNKKQQLEQYETYKDRYLENADIVPEIGASISRDTSWWDNKISDLEKYSEKQKEAVELYQKYLETIFPKSKVQDIVWHGTDNKNVSDILTNNFADDQTEKGLSIKNAVFFAREYNAYGNDAYGSNDKTLIPALVNVHKIQLQEESMTITDVNSLYKDNTDALLQISFDVNSYKNGEKLSFEELENMRTKLEENGLNEIVKNTNLEKSEVIKILEDENKRDSFLENYINQFGIENIPFGQLAVKPEQVHILGSKTDIEKFKNFIKKEKVKEDLRYEPLKYVLGIENVENAKQLVDKLSAFETKAGFEKVFGRLENVSNIERIKVVFKDLNYLGDLSPETIQSGSLQGPTTAQYSEAKNTMYIDNVYANSGDVGHFYVTVLHELIHEVFKGADKASGLNIIYGLPNIKNTIEKLPVHNKYRNLYSIVLHNISKEIKNDHYGLSSVDEFISEAYSNPAFQNFLKTVELKNKKSVSSKAIDLLLSVVTLNNRVSSHEISEIDAFSAFQKIDLESLNLLEDFEKNLKNYSQE